MEPTIRHKNETSCPNCGSSDIIDTGNIEDNDGRRYYWTCDSCKIYFKTVYVEQVIPVSCEIIRNGNQP